MKIKGLNFCSFDIPERREYRPMSLQNVGFLGSITRHGSATFYGDHSTAVATNISSNGTKRAGIKVSTGSSLIGVSLSSFTFYLSTTSGLTGTASSFVRDSSDTVVATGSTVNVSTIGTSAAAVTFTFSSPRTLQNGDRIDFEFSGGGGAAQMTIYGNTTNLPANAVLTTYDTVWHDDATRMVYMTYTF